MCQETRRSEWDAGAALRKLAAVDPWFVVGVIQLLTTEQWNALCSGEVFVAIRQSLMHMAQRTHRGVPGDRASIADEAAEETLYRLTSRAFLKRFDPAKGMPNAYMRGVAWRYLSADRRSRFTRLRREERLRREPAAGGFSNPADLGERNEMLAMALVLIEALPPEQRDAIKKHFLGSGKAGDSASISSPAECIRRCRGLKKIREELRKRGLME